MEERSLSDVVGYDEFEEVYNQCNQLKTCKFENFEDTLQNSLFFIRHHELIEGCTHINKHIEAVNHSCKTVFVFGTTFHP